MCKKKPYREYSAKRSWIFKKILAQHAKKIDMPMMPEKAEEKNAVQTKEMLGCFKNSSE